MDEKQPPVIPPDEYVASYNAAALANGLPYRSALDPLLMFGWHLATESLRHPSPLITGLPGV